MGRAAVCAEARLADRLRRRVPFGGISASRKGHSGPSGSVQDILEHCQFCVQVFCVHADNLYNILQFEKFSVGYNFSIVAGLDNIVIGAKYCGAFENSIYIGEIMSRADNRLARSLE